MAFELPVAAWDLCETRIPVDDARVHVKPNDLHDCAKAIVELVDARHRH